MFNTDDKNFVIRRPKWSRFVHLVKRKILKILFFIIT